MKDLVQCGLFFLAGNYQFLMVYKVYQAHALV